MKSKTKLMTLACLYSLISVTPVIAVNIDTVVNEILRTNGPIFLRTSEEFSPDKMDYLAADSNGNAYDVEGYPVKLILTGVANFHGEFVPAKTLFPESEHKFVGHAETSVNSGRMTVEIGDKKKSYRLRDYDEVIKDTITVNNSIYEISIQFSQSSLKEVLFKNDPDKTKATTYFIAVDGIKLVSCTSQYAEETKLLKEQLQKTQAALAVEQEANKPKEKTKEEKERESIRKMKARFY